MRRFGPVELVRWGVRIDLPLGRGWRLTLGGGVVNPERLCCAIAAHDDD